MENGIRNGWNFNACGIPGGCKVTLYHPDYGKVEAEGYAFSDAFERAVACSTDKIAEILRLALPAPGDWKPII